MEALARRMAGVKIIAWGGRIETQKSQDSVTNGKSTYQDLGGWAWEVGGKRTSRYAPDHLRALRA